MGIDLGFGSWGLTSDPREAVVCGVKWGVAGIHY